MCGGGGGVRLYILWFPGGGEVIVFNVSGGGSSKIWMMDRNLKRPPERSLMESVEG